MASNLLASLLLVAMPGAPSSVLAPNSNGLQPTSDGLHPALAPVVPGEDGIIPLGSKDIHWEPSTTHWSCIFILIYALYNLTNTHIYSIHISSYIQICQTLHFLSLNGFKVRGLPLQGNTMRRCNSKAPRWRTWKAGTYLLQWANALYTMISCTSKNPAGYHVTPEKTVSIPNLRSSRWGRPSRIAALDLLQHVLFAVVGQSHRPETDRFMIPWNHPGHWQVESDQNVTCARHWC